jgi:RNA polymerase sigma-70 factor (ECF subfamily)
VLGRHDAGNTTEGTSMRESHAIIEAAWAAHRAPLVRRLTALTRDADVAEDLAQEAFLRLTREVEAGRIPDDAAAWLHRVAANLAASRGRHLTVVDRRAGELVRPDAPPTPESMALQGETAAALRDALAGLSPTDRDALLLAAHGYRGHEIATSLGRTPGATRTLLCRARGKIRGRLQVAGFGLA